MHSEGLALGEVVAAYARAVDRRDYAALAGVLTADARLAMARGRDPGGPFEHELRGREAIVDAIRSSHAHHRFTRHVVAQQCVDAVDGDDATAETYCEAHHVGDGTAEPIDRVLHLRYLDRFRREDDRWRIRDRVLVVDAVEHRRLDAP